MSYKVHQDRLYLRVPPKPTGTSPPPPSGESSCLGRQTEMPSEAQEFSKVERKGRWRGMQSHTEWMTGSWGWGCTRRTALPKVPTHCPDSSQGVARRESPSGLCAILPKADGLCQMWHPQGSHFVTYCSWGNWFASLGQHLSLL